MAKIDLNGNWLCKLSDKREFEVMVPGCFDTYIEEKDYGDLVIYSKEFIIEKKEKYYQLFFGGVSYFCKIYLNGKEVGSHEGIWDHFRIDITNVIEDGRNIIEVHLKKPGYKISDEFKVREVLSGFLPDVLCTFGGIWDDIYLESASDFFIVNHNGTGDIEGNTNIHIQLSGKSNGPVSVYGKILDPTGNPILNFQEQEQELNGQIDIDLHEKIRNPFLWTLEHPNLYSYEIIVETREQKETVSNRYGFREISTKGTKILLNEEPIYPRGILHWGCYEDTLTPNPSKKIIKDEIDKCKQYGFNMIKHCLYIPREEYLELADQNGILLWIELPVWLPEVTNQLEVRIEREFPRIIEQLLGHPSVIMISLGCELDSKVSSDLLERMYHLAKMKTGVLVRDNSGSGECYGGLSVDFADFFDYHFYSDLQNMENLMETFTPTWRSYRPWIFGEFCDSDTMRDLQVIRKRKNVDMLSWEENHPSHNPISILKPDFYAGYHDQRMEESGIRKDFQLIKKLSYDHSMVHRKVTLEQTRSFPEISGYNITSIRDVPIATSGIFDDLMEPKFDRNKMNQVNADVVLIPAWDLTRIWINADRVMNKERYNYNSGENYALHIIVSNYGNSQISKPVFQWQLLYNDKVLCEREEQITKNVSRGEVTEISYLNFGLPKVEKPETFVLKARLFYIDKVVENSWPIFLYPEEKPVFKSIGLYDPCNVFTSIEKIYDSILLLDEEKEIRGVDVVVTSLLTSRIKQYIKDGGKVFYIQRGKGSLPMTPVAFWREGMIRSFPHPITNLIEKQVWFDDLRYFSLGTDTAFDTKQIMENVEKEFLQVKPILRRYDCREWKATDYMVEFNYGAGKMIATTLRFEGGMGKQPLYLENNCFARWLMDHIIDYLVIEAL